MGTVWKTNKNPSLADLIGGIQYVTLSDDEAKRRGTQKSILERKAAFEIIIEINDQNSWTIHEDVRNSVDLFYEVILQLGRLDFLTEKIKIKSKRFQNHQNSLLKSHTSSSDSSPSLNRNWISINQSTDEQFLKLKSKKLVIYPYSLSNNLLKEVLQWGLNLF
jgi:hypothetical protein